MTAGKAKGPASCFPSIEKAYGHAITLVAHTLAEGGAG